MQLRLGRTLIFIGMLAWGMAYAEMPETGRPALDSTAALELDNAELRLDDLSPDNMRRVEVRLGKGKSAISFAAKDRVWDWHGYAGISYTIENRGATPLSLFVCIDSVDEDGRRLRSRRPFQIAAEERVTYPYFFTNGNAGPYWGMRGIPVYGPLSKVGFSQAVSNVAPGKVNRVGFQVEKTPVDGVHIIIENLQLFAEDSPLARLILHPFVDRFGQYKHAEWPGKIHEEADFQRALEKENAAIDAQPRVASQDALGGWADGPQFEATGWFRTEQIDGKWWLLTPQGRLFLSLGANCVHRGDPTFIEERGDWFEWLPDAEGPFAEFLGHYSGVHSMAEAIGGRGTTINFFGLNMRRKYGEHWRNAYREQAYRRLPAWGFTTIGNWSDGPILEHSPMPFTVTGGSGGARVLEGGTGYWGKMKDVFDPDFAPNTEASIARLTGTYRENPLVVGYFVDNEMSWVGIPRGALASPPDQPARRAFIEDLQAKYGSIQALNTAWECIATDWDTLEIPGNQNQASKEDAEAFEYRFARRYFDIVGDAMRKHAPDQLYLGCRFALIYCTDAVMRACAEVVDVVSINAYVDRIRPDMYAELGKPVIIGEFHFGALDRGMFHTGLQTATDQNDRADKYVRYVESLVQNPAFVGAHWFQYKDQPNTGRALDGENYNIGLVDITDTPYPELTAAARDVHSRMYALRYGKRE